MAPESFALFIVLWLAIGQVHTHTRYRRTMGGMGYFTREGGLGLKEVGRQKGADTKGTAHARTS
jgi:hypothetical protein